MSRLEATAHTISFSSGVPCPPSPRKFHEKPICRGCPDLSLGRSLDSLSETGLLPERIDLTGCSTPGKKEIMCATAKPLRTLSSYFLRPGARFVLRGTRMSFLGRRHHSIVQTFIRTSVSRPLSNDKWGFKKRAFFKIRQKRQKPSHFLTEAQRTRRKCWSSPVDTRCPRAFVCAGERRGLGVSHRRLMDGGR